MTEITWFPCDLRHSTGQRRPVLNALLLWLWPNNSCYVPSLEQEVLEFCWPQEVAAETVSARLQVKHFKERHALSSQGQRGTVCPTMSLQQVTEAAWLPVLWFCGFLDLNTEAKTTRRPVDTLSLVDHLTGAGSNPLPGFCLGWHRKLETQSDSGCRATKPLHWKWFPPARRTPTGCHFKVTTSAPLHGSDKLASNQSSGWGSQMTLFRLLVMLYIPSVNVNSYS